MVFAMTYKYYEDAPSKTYAKSKKGGGGFFNY
jgi:hypothetical protein